MPYTVKPDGSIVADTLDEALAIQQHILQSRGGDAKAEASRPVKLNGTEFSDEIFVRLRPYHGKEIGSDVMQNILGLNVPDGIGAKLYYMRRRGVPLDAVLTERRNENNKKVWMVRFP